MNKEAVFDRFLDSYSIYYDIQRDGDIAPFDAQAVFSQVQEQYFLTRSAKLSKVESSELVFFVKRDEVNTGDLLSLSQAAWSTGLSRAKPCYGHKSTDVILIIIADRFEDGIESAARRIKHTKSYKLGFYGFSHFKLVLVNAREHTLVCNIFGDELKKLCNKILSGKK